MLAAAKNAAASKDDVRNDNKSAALKTKSKADK